MSQTFERASLEKRAGDVLRWMTAGKLTLRMKHNFALREAAKAHASLEGRLTTGKVLLIPCRLRWHACPSSTTLCLQAGQGCAYEQEKCPASLS